MSGCPWLQPHSASQSPHPSLFSESGQREERGWYSPSPTGKAGGAGVGYFLSLGCEAQEKPNGLGSDEIVPLLRTECSGLFQKWLLLHSSCWKHEGTFLGEPHEAPRVTTQETLYPSLSWPLPPPEQVQWPGAFISQASHFSSPSN